MHKAYESLCQNILYNKTRWGSKCKKASLKELGNCSGIEKRISRGNSYSFEFKTRNIRRNKITYCKITNKTMVKIEMLVCNFFTGSVFVVALFF